MSGSDIDWDRAMRVAERMLSKPASSGPATSERPTITVSTRQIEVNDQAVETLAADPGLYQRGRQLVRVIRDRAPGGCVRRVSGSPRIDVLPEASLRERLTLVARWVRPDARGRTRPANPPDWCVSAVHRRGEWPGVRHLAGVVEAPALRPDGSVIAATGYDEATGLLYEPTTSYPPVPDRPTRHEAEAAAVRLLALVDEFPFAGRAHKAAWLSALLTVLARPAIGGPCPLFLFEAAVAGSGKTLLASVLSIIATGREPAVYELSDDNEEVRKTITSVLLEGDRLVLLDNASGAFGCKALDAVLTSTVWKGRILGQSRTSSELPADTVWLASGNNLHLRGDTHRRVIPCRLEPTVERPEERDGFAISDLKAYAAANRGPLLVDGLTILRGFFAAGRPQADLPPLGSFEAWSALPRQAVLWATGTDPCESRSAIAPESRGDLATLAAVLAGWKSLPGADVGLTAGEALQALRGLDHGHDGLRAALSEWGRGGELPDVRQLGNRLRSAKGRVAGGLRMVSKADPHSKAARWTVEEV